MAKEEILVGQLVAGFSENFIENKDYWVKEIVSRLALSKETKPLQKEVMRYEADHPVITTWLIGLQLLALDNVFNKKTAATLKCEIVSHLADRLGIEYEGLLENVDAFHQKFRSEPNNISDWLLDELFDNPPNSAVLQIALDDTGGQIATMFKWKVIADSYRIV